MVEYINTMIIRTFLLLGATYSIDYIIKNLFKNKKVKTTEAIAFLITICLQVFTSMSISTKSDEITFLNNFSESLMFIFMFLTYIITKKYYEKK